MTYLRTVPEKEIHTRFIILNKIKINMDFVCLKISRHKFFSALLPRFSLSTVKYIVLTFCEHTNRIQRPPSCCDNKMAVTLMLYLCWSATDFKNRMNLSGKSSEPSESVCKVRRAEATLDTQNCFHEELRTD
jgi:hypothetical protein